MGFAVKFKIKKAEGRGGRDAASIIDAMSNSWSDLQEAIHKLSAED